MKKVLISAGLVGVLGLGGFIGFAGNNPINAEAHSINSSIHSVTKSSVQLNSTVQSTRLSVEEIKKKALKVVNGTITKVEFETVGKWSYYEVEIITKEAEYDLKLEAFTGQLLKQKVERHDDDDDYYDKLYDDHDDHGYDDHGYDDHGYDDDYYEDRYDDDRYDD